MGLNRDEFAAWPALLPARDADGARAKASVPLRSQGRFHVLMWAVAALILYGSLASVPPGSNAALWTALLLTATFLGLVVVSVVATISWILRRWPLS